MCHHTSGTPYVLLTQLCLRALVPLTPSSSGVDAILKMGHGGDIARTRLGPSGMASLTDTTSPFRFLPLNLSAISDGELQRRLRGTLRVERRVTAMGSISTSPAAIMTSKALKESQPWRPVDAAAWDAHSRRMAADANPYGRLGVLAEPDALAYCLRMCRDGERFVKFERQKKEAGRLEVPEPASLHALLETRMAAPAVGAVATVAPVMVQTGDAEMPSAEVGEAAGEAAATSVAVVAKVPRTRSAVIASHRAFLNIYDRGGDAATALFVATVASQVVPGASSQVVSRPPPSPTPPSPPPPSPPPPSPPPP